MEERKWITFRQQFFHSFHISVCPHSGKQKSKLNHPLISIAHRSANAYKDIIHVKCHWNPENSVFLPSWFKASPYLEIWCTLSLTTAFLAPRGSKSVQQLWNKSNIELFVGYLLADTAALLPQITQQRGKVHRKGRKCETRYTEVLLLLFKKTDHVNKTAWN